MSLDSQAEADYFFPLFVQKSALFDELTHIGAVTTIAKSKTDWYWVETGKKAKIELKWGSGQPDNYGTQECLAIFKSAGSYEIHDINCFEAYSRRFICSSTEYV